MRKTIVASVDARTGRGTGRGVRPIVQVPAVVSRDDVLRGDARAIDQCWNALDLENTGWWRGWERKWRE